MNPYIELGMRIRFLRKERKLSQEDLALEAGINPKYLCDIEKGRRNMTLDILLKICQALHISLVDLFKGINTY